MNQRSREMCLVESITTTQPHRQVYTAFRSDAMADSYLYFPAYCGLFQVFLACFGWFLCVVGCSGLLLVTS